MRKITFSVFLLLSCFSVFSQREITVSYGESINLGRVSNKTQFSISGGTVQATLNGNSINEFKFEKPGDYKIKVTSQPGSREELNEFEPLPAEITIHVSRIKMIFDVEHLSFTSPIVKNKETANIRMSIPVTVITYDHNPFEFTFSNVNSAGIGTSIVATPVVAKQTLKEGIHIFTYSLSGTVTENSYLMFDFMDNNNNAQAATLLTPVKD